MYVFTFYNAVVFHRRLNLKRKPFNTLFRFDFMTCRMNKKIASEFPTKSTYLYCKCKEATLFYISVSEDLNSIVSTLMKCHVFEIRSCSTNF